jgi:hypothetical protein|tara:strand:+ start:1834 stop:2016 length:183 start_codon:yes stop_codon:yes gene_type:complete
MKGLLDKGLEKLVSRKLLVFGTATGLMISSGLDSETWGMIAMIYIGTQGAVDVMKAYRNS